jgi:hypothetical protein
MQGTAEGFGNAEILLVEAFRLLKFNARDCRRFRQCRNLAKRDVQAVEIQCRGLLKAPAMQKSC